MGWTVRRRLIVSFVFMSVLTIAAGALSLYYVNRISVGTAKILQESQPILNDMAVIERNILFHSLKVGQYVTTGNRAHLRAIEDVRSRIEAHLEDLERRTEGTDDQPLVQEIREAYETYMSLSEDMQAFYEQNPNDAASIEGRQMRIAALLENALLARAETLYEARQREAEELVQVNSQLNQTYSKIVVGSILILIAMFIALGVSIDRSVAVPISRLSEAARRMAEGDLGARVVVRTRDEIGVLSSTFNEMATQLQELVGSLEQRIAQRTRDLERRAVQLEAAAEVAREAAAIQDVGELLDRVVRLISDRFGFYHAGIFLVDDRGEYAVLQAASSEGGRRMLERGHRLAVGKVGIVGYVAGSGKPRIALDVGEDAVFFDNPDLPLTRSEMALPLKVRGRIIGVLDVQSEEPAAFSDEDVAVLQTMADQIALAIENARLLAEMRQTLAEAEVAYGRYTRESWQRVALGPGRFKGYRYRLLGVEPVEEEPPEARQARESGRPVVLSHGKEGEGEEPLTALAVPIKLRGRTIGVLDFHFKGEEIAPDTIALAEEVASRLALALENARLLEETKQRAFREQALSEITAHLTRSLDMETLLRTAVQGLVRMPGVAEAAVHIGVPDDGMGGGGKAQS